MADKVHSSSLQHAKFYAELHRQFVLPIIRMDDTERCQKLCELLIQTGFKVVEITLTTPGALKLIDQLRAGGVYVGVGTVLTTLQARDALAAGVQFMVSPGFSVDLSTFCETHDLPFFPGVLSPTEVMQALSHGHYHLKLFPAAGVPYLKHLSGPFPQVHWLPTGGVPFAEIPAYFQAGAFAVGQGTRLVNAAALRDKNWAQIERELREIQDKIQAFKRDSKPS